MSNCELFGSTSISPGRCSMPTATTSLFAAAIDHLRPQSGYPWTAPCSLTEHPSVRCTSVVCSEDRVVSPDWSKRMGSVIGADVVELPGHHSPFLSQTAAVADVLVRIGDGSHR